MTNEVPAAGFEPRTFRLLSECANHCAKPAGYSSYDRTMNRDHGPVPLLPLRFSINSITFVFNYFLVFLGSVIFGPFVISSEV